MVNHFGVSSIEFGSARDRRTLSLSVNLKTLTAIPVLINQGRS